MYHQKLAFAIKANGKVLRDEGDTAYIPFGQEYSLLIKNLNSVRALVRIDIDGTDVTGGTQIIVPANGSVDLERFIKAGNMSEGLRFKFIERSSKIENGPRGIKVEDGLIRIEFEFEREQAKIQPHPVYRQQAFGPTFGSDVVTNNEQWHDGMTACASTTAMGIARGISSDTFMNSVSKGQAFVSASSASDYQTREVKTSSGIVNNDKGITVGGSVSDQKFVQGSWFPTDGQKHVMIMKLLGEINGKTVTAPVTAKTIQVCETCGTKNKVHAKFCAECGTGLVIV